MGRRTSQEGAVRPNRRNRQADVTAAAVEIFWRKGYASASIRDVAEEVGVLKGSLYHYINSKEDLLWTIVDAVHGRSTQILADTGALDLDPIRRLHFYVEKHALWYLDDPKEVTVFLREWRHLTGDKLELANERRHGYDRALRRLIDEAQESHGRRSGIPADYAARYVLAAINAMPDWYHPGGTGSKSRIAEACADMTVGLLASPVHGDGGLRAA
jgi:TetR/AcrR family transcriptional regulator, cholesterol catabolism regulator